MLTVSSLLDFGGLFKSLASTSFVLNTYSYILMTPTQVGEGEYSEAISEFSCVRERLQILARGFVLKAELCCLLEKSFWPEHKHLHPPHLFKQGRRNSASRFHFHRVWASSRYQCLLVISIIEIGSIEEQ